MIMITVCKLSKYGVFSGSYFPVFGLNTGKYRAEKNPYLDAFHTVDFTMFVKLICLSN